MIFFDNQAMVAIGEKVGVFGLLEMHPTIRSPRVRSAAIRNSSRRVSRISNYELRVVRRHPNCLSAPDLEFVPPNAKQSKWLTEINVNRAKVARYSYFEFFTANRAPALK